ncbi:hypothetical protein U9M48_044486 [Paspalum notatum var. saurae]|uniref:Uncharacterized protein n=1 Tax=Paspalum notatum var. saurae TaxID=547442 RepID=A0AAQ3XII7_PASNO
MKTFLDLCIAEKNVMNFNTKGLNAVGRKNVHRNFKLKTEPTRGNSPPFLEELEILFGTNTQARGVLLSAGGVRATNDTFATPQPIYQSSDRSRPKRSLWEQSMDSPQKKKTSIEECLGDISYALTEHDHGQKSNNYDVA